MSRVLAYAVKRLDGKEWPESDFDADELSEDRLLLFCADKQDAINCKEYPSEHGPVEVLRGWATITDWIQAP